MSQSEYRDVRPGDWDGVRYAIRRMNERLSYIEGMGGVFNKRSETNMQGNQILSGPSNQQTANGDEFITRGYLSSKEAAEVVSRTIGDGGASPIILSTSMPGSSSIGGGTYNPAELVITPDMPEATFTNFNDQNYWLPFYPDPLGTVSLDLATDNKLRINASEWGTTTTRCDMAGVVSRLRLYPNSSGIIQFQWHLEEMNYTQVTNNAQDDWLFGVVSFSSFPSQVGGFGFGQDGFLNRTWLGLGYYINWSKTAADEPKFWNGKLITTNTHGVTLWVRETIQTVFTAQTYTFYSIEWWNGINWQLYAPNDSDEQIQTNMMDGVGFFLGYAATYPHDMHMIIDSFQLLQGYAII